MEPLFDVLSFPTMVPIGSLFENPHEIDMRTINTNNDRCLLLKSIVEIEIKLNEAFYKLEKSFSYKNSKLWADDFEKAKNYILDNPSIGDLFENMSDEEMSKLFTFKEYLNYRDVLGKDRGFLYQGPNLQEGIVNVVIDNITGQYLGHVYSWVNNRVLVQGIRASIINTIEIKVLGTGFKGISYVLLSSLINTWVGKAAYIYILEPLEPMEYVLTKLGFKSSGYYDTWKIPTNINIKSLPYDLYII